ncbi:helix-turn-helix domain-containing protein [Labrys neptuniae]
MLDGAAVACTRTGPNSIRYVQQAHTILVHLAAQPQWELAINSDRRIAGIAPVGSISVVIAQSDAFAGWTAEKQSMRLDISPARLQRAAGAEFDKETFELQPPRFGFIDKQAHTLALWIQRELEHGDACTPETLDALVTVYSTHLLRNYSSFSQRSPVPINGGLLPTAWGRVKDFIYDNLEESLTVEQLALIARLSPSHFMRAFKQTTGQSPHQFVIAARLAHARALTLNTDMPFSLIAKSAGFTNNSHMTALMKRIWGVTPSEIRREQ